MASPLDVLGNLVPDFVTGDSPAQERLGDQGPLGVVSDFGSVLGEAAGTGIAFSPFGEAADVVSGLTGRIPGTDIELKGPERLLALGGLLGVPGWASVRAYNNFRAGRISRLSAQRGAGELPDFSFLPERPTPTDVAFVPGLLEGRQARVFSSRSVEELHNAFGIKDGPGGLSVFTAFVEKLGVDIENAPHNRSQPTHNLARLDAIEAPERRAAWALLKMERVRGQGYLEAFPGGQRVQNLWDRFLATPTALAEAEITSLLGFVSSLDRATPWAGIPDLRTAPQLKWIGLDEVDAEPRQFFDYRPGAVPWHQVDLWPFVPQMTTNLVFLYDITDRLRRVLGERWHRKLRATAKQVEGEFGIDKRTFAAVTAALSPQATWKNNLDGVLQLIREGEVDPALALRPSAVERGRRILGGEAPEAVLGAAPERLVAEAPGGVPTPSQISKSVSGEKVRNFDWDIYTELEGRPSFSVTVDSHMIRAAVGSTRVHPDAVKAWKRAAGMQPIQAAARAAARIVGEEHFKRFQATDWLKWREDFAEPAFEAQRRVHFGQKTQTQPFVDLNTSILDSVEGRSHPIPPADVVRNHVSLVDDVVSDSGPQWLPSTRAPLGGGNIVRGESRYVLQINADGSTVLHAAPDFGVKQQFRGLTPSRPNGARKGAWQYGKVEAQPVDSLERQFDLLRARSQQRKGGLPTGSGAKIFPRGAEGSMPGTMSGRFIWAAALQESDGGPGPAAHYEYLQRLEEAGVRVPSRFTDPFNGPSYAWRKPDGELTWEPTPKERRSLPMERVDEARVGLVVGPFERVEDSHRAWEILEEIKDQAYREQIPDRAFYGYGPDEAPAGTVAVPELHYYEDIPDGPPRYMVHWTSEADPTLTNATVAWVPSGRAAAEAAGDPFGDGFDMFEFFADDHNPTLTGPTSVPSSTRIHGTAAVVDETVRVPLGLEWKPGTSLLDGTLGGSPASEWLVYAPPAPVGELPVVGFGDGALDQVRFIAPNFDSQHLVTVTRTKGGFLISPTPGETLGGKSGVNVSLYQRAVNVLRRVGAGNEYRLKVEA